MTALNWRDWGLSAFEEAQRRNVPVLLAVFSPLSLKSERLSATTFTDTRVVTFVEGNLVPVKVDALERPDIVVRYATDPPPFVAFLTPTGHLLTNAGSPSPEAMLLAIEKVCLYYKDHKDSIEAAVRERVTQESAAKEGSNPITPGVVRRVEDAILALIDMDSGELATPIKKIYGDPILFLLLRYARSGDLRFRDGALKVLHRWSSSALFDQLEGGFFSEARKDDYSDLEFAKVCGSNADAIRAYTTALSVASSETREDLENVVRLTCKWVIEHLLDERTGGFYVGLLPEPDYYLQGRKKTHTPRVLVRIYTGPTAAMARALLDAAIVLGDREMGRKALSAGELLWRECFDPEEGMAHKLEALLSQRKFGFFADQVAMLDLLLRTYEIGGHPLHLQRAASLAGLMETIYGDPDGGFYDRAQEGNEIGHLAFKKKSAVENGSAAALFYKLGTLTRSEHFKEVAAAALWRFTTHLEELGLHASAAALACDIHLRGMIEVSIVGPRSDQDASRLRIAALRLFLPCVAIGSVDPEDESLLRIRKLEYEGRPVAYIFHGGEKFGPFENENELKESISEFVAGRRKER
jgi:uncharacterized protein YyaL (SSP411 family)